MQVNNTTVVTRGSRPGVLEKVALEVFILNNGQLTDPYAISGVGIYFLSSTGSPSSILTSANLINPDVTPLMWFANSATLTSDSSFAVSNYTPGTTASGIFRLSQGHYVVVLDGSVALSSNWLGSALANSASSVGDYVDAWQLMHVSTGGWNVICNSFHLWNDNFFTLTEPILLTPTLRLMPNLIKLGSKQNLKVRGEFTIANREISREVKNMFKYSVITNPQFRILKVNDGVHQLQGHVEVSGYSATSGLIDVTSDNTMLFLFDTNTLTTHPELLAGRLGTLTGTYALQVKYTIFTETYISPLMYFEVN